MDCSCDIVWIMLASSGRGLFWLQNKMDFHGGVPGYIVLTPLVGVEDD
jgi:hypothetical protein